jgi:hypothetical protein
MTYYLYIICTTNQHSGYYADQYKQCYVVGKSTTVIVG